MIKLEQKFYLNTGIPTENVLPVTIELMKEKMKTLRKEKRELHRQYRDLCKKFYNPFCSKCDKCTHTMYQINDEKKWLCSICTDIELEKEPLYLRKYISHECKTCGITEQIMRNRLDNPLCIVCENDFMQEVVMKWDSYNDAQRKRFNDEDEFFQNIRERVETIEHILRLMKPILKQKKEQHLKNYKKQFKQFK